MTAKQFIISSLSSRPRGATLPELVRLARDANLTETETRDEALYLLEQKKLSLDDGMRLRVKPRRPPLDRRPIG